MNCATHPDTAAVAFCRTCGKPLCSACTRDVRGVIYCEPCLAARLEGTAPAAGFVPVQSGYPQPGNVATVPRPSSGSGPNPAVAGMCGSENEHHHDEQVGESLGVLRAVDGAHAEGKKSGKNARHGGIWAGTWARWRNLGI